MPSSDSGSATLPATDSSLPPSRSSTPGRSRKDTPSFFAPMPGGMFASSKIWWAIFIIFFGGGGGYSAWRFVTAEQMEQRILEHDKKAEKKREAIQEQVTKNTGSIAGMKVTLGNVQTVQQRDVAIKNARRVVASMKCRPSDERCVMRKSRELERIRRLNMSRLQESPPREPCATRDCSN